MNKLIKGELQAFLVAESHLERTSVGVGFLHELESSTKKTTS